MPVDLTVILLSVVLPLVIIVPVLIFVGVLVNGDNPLMKFRLEVHPANRAVFQADTQGVIAQASRAKFQTGQTIWVKFNPNDLTQVALDHS